jgi:stage II sporulation protein D
MSISWQGSHMGSATRYVLAVCLALLLMPLGCSQQRHQVALSDRSPVIRVKLLENQQQVMMSASEPAAFHAASEKGPRLLNVPSSAQVPVALSAGGWRVGNHTLGSGVLTIVPGSDGGVSINGQNYHGQYRLVPVAAGTFDVVNDVNIDDYLKSVVSKEMLRTWDIEAYKAQAIVARTYVLYEANTVGKNAGRMYDVFDDERSQVYGGIAAESSKSRKAVEETEGVVVAFGAPGQEKIFKAYFSSCCGGITQSAADAFGDAYLPPLSDQNVQNLCNASPRFNWGPIVIPKNELTRRIRLWGTRKARAEKDMSTLSRIDIAFTNRWGRPTRFVVTDSRGARYSLSSEEMRWAINTDAPAETTLGSSFFKTINDPDVIRFVDGHGRGHGVGMCQWCAERRAEEGMRHEDIVLAAFQKTKLVRAY